MTSSRVVPIDGAISQREAEVKNTLCEKRPNKIFRIIPRNIADVMFNAADDNSRALAQRRHCFYGSFPRYGRNQRGDSKILH